MITLPQRNMRRKHCWRRLDQRRGWIWNQQPWQQYWRGRNRKDALRCVWEMRIENLGCSFSLIAMYSVFRNWNGQLLLFWKFSYAAIRRRPNATNLHVLLFDMPSIN